jgi:methionyl-tRNA formyltransferase
VITQPDRPVGRGLQPVHSAVKQFALTHAIPVYQPPTWKSDEALEELRRAAADVLIVAAYGAILPEAALRIPPFGAINIHASLLPRWRGAAPIQRALLAGDRETGISIMQMDAGLDTGPVLAHAPLAITQEDDAGSLHDRLAALGAQLVVATLAEIAAGRKPTPQPQPAGSTYARKIKKGEARLDWRRTAEELERQVRAFRPSPGAAARLAGEGLKIWRASIAMGQGHPGEVLNVGEALIVACGEGALAIHELQREGGRRLALPEFLRGRPVSQGERLE